MAKKKKIPTPLKSNVVVVIIAKKPSGIILSTTKNEEMKRAKEEDLQVYSIGPEVEGVQPGDSVVVEKMVRQDPHRIIDFGSDEENPQGSSEYLKIYFVVEEAEIKAVYK